MIGDEESFTTKLDTFSNLLPEVDSYIQQQAQKRAYMTSDLLDEEDWVAIGKLQTWMAVVSWDPERSPDLVRWAKLRIWTNMDVELKNYFNSKRGVGDSTQSLVYLSEETSKGTSLIEELESPSDPLSQLILDDLYANLRKRLLKEKNRIAAAVLRLCLYPDDELLALCSRFKEIKDRGLAARLGVTPFRIASAKTVIRRLLKEEI